MRGSQPTRREGNRSTRNGPCARLGTQSGRFAAHGPCPACSNPDKFNWPQTHDKADYHTLWGAWGFDVSDDRRLVGFSTDVFVGKVTDVRSASMTPTGVAAAYRV